MLQPTLTEINLNESLPSWAANVGYTPSLAPTHLVIGVGEVELGRHGGGILAFCSDEFTAWRCLREILRNPDASAQVMVDSVEVREAVELAILEQIRYEREQRAAVTA